MRSFTFLAFMAWLLLSLPAYAQISPTLSRLTAPPPDTRNIEDPSAWLPNDGTPITSSGPNAPRFNLIIASGETILVAGNHEINGTILVQEGGVLRFVNEPGGSPGRLVMDENSNILLLEGATIEADAAGNSEVAIRLTIGDYQIDGNDINFINANYERPLIIDAGFLCNYLGLDNCPPTVPLPIELRSFTATAIAQGVQVRWEVEKEWDFSHYELERSADGKTFTKIYQVNGTQTERTGPYVYEYLDVQPMSGMNYYRLKAVDIDGAFKYEGVALANYRTSETYAYSNAQPQTLTIWPRQANLSLQVRLIDMQGHERWQGQLQEQTVIHNLQAGMYLLQLKGAQDVKTEKILVQ